MFTSGTTSKPKGVVHTHANAIWASRTGPRNIDLGPDDRYLVYTPFFHVNAQTWSVLPVFGMGATAVLVPKWSSSRFWETVQRHGITHFSLMPFTMPTLMAPDRPTTSLRVGVFGLIVPNARDVFGCEVYAAYGMTETVTHAITGKPSEHPEMMSMGHGSLRAMSWRWSIPAVVTSAKSDARASSGSAGPGAFSFSSSTSTIPRRTPRASRTAGSRRATWSS